MFQNNRTPPILAFAVLSIVFALGLLIYASSLAVYAEEPQTEPVEYTVSPDTALPPQDLDSVEATLSTAEELQHIRQAVELLVYFMLPFAAAFFVFCIFLRWFWRTFILSALD